jgi:hypothetical protein
MSLCAISLYLILYNQKLAPSLGRIVILAKQFYTQSFRTLFVMGREGKGRINPSLYIPYARHYNPLLIWNRSWILSIHKVRILQKKLLKKTFLAFKNGVKSIQMRVIMARVRYLYLIFYKLKLASSLVRMFVLAKRSDRQSFITLFGLGEGRINPSLYISVSNSL